MNDIARMLDDTTDKLLAAHAETSRNDPSHADLKAALGDAGLVLALAPEDAGGFGCDWTEAAVIAFQWGRYASPLPIVPMLLAVRLAALAGDMTFAENGLAVLRIPDAAPPQAPLVDGRDAILLLVRDDENPRIEIINATVDETVADLLGEPWIILGEDTLTAVHEISSADMITTVAGGCLLYAASIAGALSRVLETIIEYANTRTQFGRPLSKFQALQHLIADASAEAVATEAALNAGLHALDNGTATPQDWLSAKAQAGRAAGAVAASAHQVMGAIGFTDEHPLHHYTKRLWTWRDDWMAQSRCELEIGRNAFTAGGNDLWPLIVDR